MFKSEIKTLLFFFYVILIISMISLLADYNSMVLKTFTFMSHYIDGICIVLPLLYIVHRFIVH